MGIDDLERDYERWLDEFGRAIVAEFIACARMGISLDDKYFHPEQPRARSKSKSAAAREVNEGQVDWAGRVHRKLGVIKIELVLTAAAQGMTPEAIAERAKLPVEDVREIIRIWSPTSTQQG